MNISPAWYEVFEKYGWESKHWSNVGDPSSPDTELFNYAKDNKFIIFTNDLDFGVLLALSSESGPSVIQIRTADTMPDKIEKIIIQTIKKYKKILMKGALISIDKLRSRVRVLPLN